MSNYNKYAQKFNEIAKAAFAEAQKADDALTAAEDAKRQYPQRTGYGITPDYNVKAAKAQAEYLEAEQQKRAVRDKMGYDYRNQVLKLREELQREIEADYRVKPEQIDTNALELLKSGIMSADEYAAMLQNAAANNNYTMARLVGKYADDAAAEVAKRYGVSDQKAKELRYVAIQAKQSHGDKWIDAFDYMLDVYDRATKNPYMRGQWDELCAATVDAF